jgi:hypothetical protein
VVLLSTRGEELGRLPLAVPQGFATFEPTSGLVYVVASTDDAAGARQSVVHAVELLTPTVRQVAVLAPPAACPADGYASSLALQDPRDVRIDATGAALCVRLLDRNVNMASLGVEYRVETASGAVDSWLVFDLEEQCAQAAEERDCGAPTSRTTFARQELPADYTFDEATCTLALPDDRRVALPVQAPCEVNVVGTTPDGGYVVLMAYDDAGDYVYWTVHAIDLVDGEVESALTATIIGEARLDWAPDGQSLLVDEALWVLDSHPRALGVGLGATFVELR